MAATEDDETLEDGYTDVWLGVVDDSGVAELLVTELDVAEDSVIDSADEVLLAEDVTPLEPELEEKEL